MSDIERTVAAINKLKELPDDWDSYGAGRVGLSSLESAKEFVYQVASKLGPEYAKPIVGPTPDGGVALIWRRLGQPTKLEVFVSPYGDRRYLVLQNRKPVVSGPLTDLNIVRQYVTP